MSWRKIKLGEFLDAGSIDIQTGPFGTQLRASDYTVEGTPVINVRNVGYGDLRPDKLEFVPEQVSSRLSAHILQTRDIVFGRKGAVDRHLLVTESEAGWMQGSDCIRLRIQTDKINPTFLSYALRLPTHKQWMITQCSNKATMASLNHDVISRITVFLPDPTTQAAVAFILSAYDDLIENNRRRIQLLEKAAWLLYKEWFVHLRFPGHEHTKIQNGSPEGWEKKKVSEIAERIPAGKLFSQKTAQATGKVPILDQGKEGIIGFHDEEPSVKATYESPVIVFANHTCYQRLLHNSFSTIQNVLPFVSSPDEQRDIYWLHYATNELVKLNAYKGHWPEFMAKEVIVPPAGLFSTFGGVVKNNHFMMQKLDEQIVRLVKARDLLLPRLMNGELAP